MSDRDAGIIAGVVALGMTSIATQILLLREFVSVFHGNELVVGIVLGSWMMLTGAGSLLGRFAERLTFRQGILPAALMTIGLLPLLTVFFVRYLRNVVFTAGSMIGLVEAFYTSVVILSPYCLVSGFLFAFFSSLASVKAGQNRIGTIYSWEALGSAIGGIVFNVALAALLDTFQTLAALSVVNIAIAFIVAHRGQVLPARAAAIFLFALVVTAGLFLDLDIRTRRFLFPGQDIVRFRDTPYGNLTITRQGDQLNFFGDNTLMSSTNDVTANEETVHYAMAQHSLPRRVLLIGGGISGSTKEILKYPVERIDYVELNPWLVRLGREFSAALDDERIRVINEDGRRYVRSTSERYDVVLIDLPDPGTAQLNRYYTLEFFQELKSILNDSAVVSLGLHAAAEYYGRESRRVGSVVYATLKHVFTHVLIVPGDRNYFLASNGTLDIRIARLMDQRSIATVYVNKYYLDDALLGHRSAELTGSVNTASGLNTDFQPLCYYHQLSYWLSYFGSDRGPWIALIAGTIVLLLWRRSTIGLCIFGGGAVASSLEIALLLSFQVIYGSLYQMTGILITTFMAGLAAGSFLARYRPRAGGIDNFIMIQLTVAMVCFLLPPLVSWLRNEIVAPSIVYGAYVLVAFAIALLIGMEFSIAAMVQRGSVAAVASELYGLDLVGSAIGAFVVSVYAIPILGLARVNIAAGLVSVAGAVVSLFARRRYLNPGS